MEIITREYKVIIHEAEEGDYWAEVPSLPGCFSQGDTIDEVKNNIREAIEVYLESQAKDVEEISDKINKSLAKKILS